MTTLLKKAFAQAEHLPEWEQDALAAFILEEIAASQQWNQANQRKEAKTTGDRLRAALLPDYERAFSQQ